MNTGILRPAYLGMFPRVVTKAQKFKPDYLLGILCCIWLVYPLLLQGNDPTAGYIAQNTWLLLVLSIITFMLVTGLCWWLLNHFWTMTGLPHFKTMIIKFKHLTSWQQLSFFWLSFALLLLAAMSCIDAIC